MRFAPYLSLLFIFAQFPARGQLQSYDTLTLYFPFNQYTLSQEDAGRLEKLQHNGDTGDTLYITGYADTAGTDAYNKGLSLRRAQSTAQYISGLYHTAKPYLYISAKGETEPVIGSDSMSRRVLVVYRRIPVVTGEANDTGKARDAADADDARAPDTVITLSNINFIEDTPIPTGSSRMSIPAYVRMLKQYSRSYIEIDGYCNSPTPIRSTSDPLFQLSVKRAKFIFDYLVDEGFDSSRLSYKGLGNATPKNSQPANADEARANMRVEIRIFQKKPLQ
jgi:outer membrane protein OmpA-like peptidoglycan-associated protein